MPRDINLRQIEAFKAVIEYGTVSRAAAMFNISQSAMSKMIANLEFDAGIRLFDRHKGRLAPTVQGMRLYEEVDRVFSGVRQINNAVELLRREEQGKLIIGVMPALSGDFIQQATMSFLAENPLVFCSVQSRSSERIADWLITRKFDVGIVSGSMENPLVDSESLMDFPLVCVLPTDHPLTAKRQINPADLNDVPFVSLNADDFGGQQIANMFDAHGVRMNLKLVANTSRSICEFVAAGLGISLIHPILVSEWRGRVVMRRFEPAVRQEFRIVRSRDSRNARLVQAFVKEMHATAEAMHANMLADL